MIQEAIRKLREQQRKVKERSPQWLVAEQLIDLVRAEPRCAEILVQDLEVEAMSITEAEKKIKAARAMEAKDTAPRNATLATNENLA